MSLFNKKSIAATALALLLFLIAGCSSTTSKSYTNLNGTKANAKSNVCTILGNSQEKKVSYDNNVKDKVSSEQNIAEKVKNYIISGQENKPEAQKIKWSKTFLNRVDIESLYKKYIDNGGRADDLESFANYMTLNAPIPSDWQELFKKDLYEEYGEKVVKIEHLKDDLYQAYIEKNGSQIPYVVVSSRTGYFHG